MDKILVTGAKGMLGQDLCPTLEDAGFETIETDVDNLDITNFEAVKKFLAESKPDAVVHCAAYTDVDKCEADGKDLAMKVNAEATENLAKVCAELAIPIVYISTKDVFDGMKKDAYLPYDERNPINAYGLTKCLGEKAIEKHCQKYYIARTSWLYGLYGDNFVEKMLSLSNESEIKVPDDQTACPTWTQELSNGIVTLLSEEAPYGIYHICGSGKTSLYGFAKEIFEIAGVDANLKACTTSELSQATKHPENGVLYNDNMCRTWKAALKDYMNLRGE